MNIPYALRMLFAAAIVAMPLQSAFAEGEAAKKDAPAAAAKPADEKPADAAPVKKPKGSSIKLETDDDKLSYVIGADSGVVMRQNGIPLVREKFLLGFSDLSQRKQPAMTDEEIRSCLSQYQEKVGQPKQTPDGKPEPIKTITGDEKFLGQMSYIAGADTAVKLLRGGLKVNEAPFMAGIEDAANDCELAMTEDEMKLAFETFKSKRVAEAKAAADKNLADGQAFLAENEKKPGVKKTASGLQYLVVNEGKGATPKATDTVRTHYRGTLLDGTEFDSSYSRNEPTEFPVNGVIPGWTEALQLMKVGDKWKLFVPAELAYGERGAGGDIGPNSTLIFDIELLDIVKAQEEPASDGTISLDAGAAGAEKKTK